MCLRMRRGGIRGLVGGICGGEGEGALDIAMEAE